MRCVVRLLSYARQPAGGKHDRLPDVGSADWFIREPQLQRYADINGAPKPVVYTLLLWTKR